MPTYPFLKNINLVLHPRFPHQILKFYSEGFHAMTIGKTLWIIILIKLFVIFFILRLFFFSDFLQTKFKTEAQPSDYVIEQLTKKR
ncbi:MAG: DUF4492 domain-containing protein [Euryarchaeota archaeon]